MDVVVQEQRNDLNNLTIKDIFFKYARFMPLFLLSVALALLVSYVYLRYATPIYSATGSMILKDEAPLKGTGAFDQVFNNNSSNNIQNEIEVLKSRPLMERVVKDLNLYFTYFAKGKIKEMNLYTSCPFYIEAFEIADSSNSFNLELDFTNGESFTVNGEKRSFSFGEVFKNNYGVFRLMHRFNAKPDGIYRINYTPSIAIASGLASALAVAPKSEGTGILLLSLETDNPQYTADVINKAMDDYQDITLDDKNAYNQRSKAFIDSRLRVVSHELDSINNQRLNYMHANDIIDPEAQSANFFSTITESDKDINQQRAQLEVVQIIESYLRDKKNAYDPVPSTLGISDATLNTMISGYNVAQLEHKSLVDGNVPRGNILVRQKEDQIEKLRQNILENLQNIKASYNAIIRNLQQRGATAESQIRNLPSKQQVLEDIKRQQASKLAVFNYLTEKKEETAIAMASNVTNSKILDLAMADYTPIKPNKRNIHLVAIVIGLALPALFIFVLELINDKITTRDDIEKLTSTTILGDIGHSYSKNVLAVASNSRGVVAEQFRIIRSNLQYVLTNIQKPVILITSSFSGEGKSFISTNMGAVMSLAGKKTIILEFDIRKPKILSHLNISKKPGLTNYLLGKINVEDLPVPVPGYDKLYVLPCGPVPPNPAEILLETRLDELFAYLKQNFDVVIMDTAPVGMVSDAMTLSKYVDATLYIVRQGHTFKKQISLIDEFHRMGKLPKISIILNDVKIRTGYGYYGYGRYGYGYGYGSGYFEEDNIPPTVLGRWFGWLDLKRRFKTKRKKNKV